MAPELQTTLSTVIQQLASFFGTTTTVITENAPMWLAKYGWYCLFRDISFFLVAGIALGGLAFVAFLSITEFNCSRKTNIIVASVIIALICVFGLVMPLIRCYVAPDFYGLEALLKTISN